MSIAIIETTKVGSPLRAIDILTSEEGAKCFRDIGEYKSYERDGNVVRVKYGSGVPFTSPIELTLRSEGRRINFKGTGPMSTRINGLWEFSAEGGVVLTQIIEGLPQWSKSLVRKRVLRSLEDLARCA